MTEEELVAKLIAARRELFSVRVRIIGIEEELAILRADYPSEEGWYEDADKNICRVRFNFDDQPYFDDGWGNVLGECGIPLPTLPLTRLVPE